MICWPNWNK